MSLSLASLSLVLGVCLAVVPIWQMATPSGWRGWSSAFPRSKPIGYVLMALATGWFLWNVRNETLADFSAYKPYLLLGFAAIGVLTCLYVSDFLAARGFALLLLLASKLLVDTARWHDSDWRWVVTGLAYAWIVAGIWFTISPWRLRDLLAWNTATDRRIRLVAGAGLGLALLLAILGLTAFRIG